MFRILHPAPLARSVARMALQCGIVGLPNVGKSTFFNALTATQSAQAANFPFCTIEPNVGRVAVPDPRQTDIAKLAGSKEIIPTQLEFVDIAGLVKGASKGEGLGNKFLGNIRATDAILHVLRCFENDDITHVDGDIDPIRDADTIQTELMLADIESLDRQMQSIQRKVRSGEKEAKALYAMMELAAKALEDGKPARTVTPEDEADAKLFAQLQLLTSKPVLYVCNVAEGDAECGNAHTKAVAQMAANEGADMVIISAEIEAEIAQIEDAAEKAEFLETMGLEEPGLNRVIRAAYDLLDLITYFTAGPKETRAWTIKKGTKAPQAAGAIHSDFERGFIRAETIAYADYTACGGEAGAREKGKLRSEGKEYTVKDGDILLFRFNV